MEGQIVLWWIRRDLRLDDNRTLFKALQSGCPVLPVFIFDQTILQDLDPLDHRIEFLVREIGRLHEDLIKAGSGILIMEGEVLSVLKKILAEHPVKAIFAGADFEPYSINRDRVVKEYCHDRGILFETTYDHVIMDPNIVLKTDNKPYTVFTPYKNRWVDRYKSIPAQEYPSETLLGNLLPMDSPGMPIQQAHGFIRHTFEFPARDFNRALLTNYQADRDFPGREGTTRLGIHLRFGTISVRRLAKLAASLSNTFLNELIWREFYQMILFFHPHVVTRSFKSAYDSIPWLNDPRDIEAWEQGRTGYPMVDAGMRQLIETGFMHNRVRMITASFLTKHLLVDWRIGEAFFAKYLLDYELASNNGGWQWAAGTGCDAAPYFRVFNPEKQAATWDPDGAYRKKWLSGNDNVSLFTPPIVEHAFARNRAIRTYQQGLSGIHP